MANRYWVGNGGSWNSTSKWSTTSGGPGGASVPTSADDVFFDANSFTLTGQTVTLGATSNCAAMNWTGVTNNPIFNGSSRTLNVSGSLTFVSGMSVTAGSLYLVFNTTLAGRSITCGNSTNMRGCANITFNGGASASWLLQDVFDATGRAITLASGVLNQNAQTIYCANFTSNSGSTRSLTNMAFISCSGDWVVSSSLTITLGASANLWVQGDFSGGGKTYGAVSLLQNSSYATISDSNTFASLTIDPGYAAYCTTAVAANQTVTGTLTLTGSSSYRLFLTSNIATTPRTISAATVAASYVDFCGISAAGTANWNLAGITGGSGNRLGNTGITFTTAVTRYWVSNAASANWSATSSWSSASGGASGASVPLPQDSVIFNGNSGSTVGRTIVIDREALCANLTIESTVQGGPVFHKIITGYLYGNLIIDASASTTTFGTANLQLVGTGSHSLKSASVRISWPVVIDTTGTYTANANVIFGSSFRLVKGTFNSNNFAITVYGYFDSTGSSTRSLTLQGSVWTIYSEGTSWAWLMSSTGMTFNAATSDIRLAGDEAAGQLFSGGGQSYYKLSLATGGTSAGGIRIFGNNSFFYIICSRVGQSILFESGSVTTISADFQVAGSTQGRISLGSAAAGTFTLTKTSGTITANYLALTGCVATGGAVWNTTSSVDGGSNSGWNFISPVRPITPLFDFSQ